MRVQLELPEAKVIEIRNLMQKGDARTYSELVNNALALLKWAVTQVEDRRAIISVNGDVQRELVMPFLQNVASKLPPQITKASAIGD